MNSCSIAFSVALALIVILFLSLNSRLLDALKDMSVLASDQRSYSLAKTTLFFWTVLILLSICYLGIVLGKVPELNEGVLALLGIAAGTTATAATIDSLQSQDPKIARIQDNSKTENFFLDILSDKDGISTTRLQTFIFNIIYGCYFISVVISDEKLFLFPAKTLMLLGISSGAYALLKVTENRPVTK
ncbi:hypothetical protein [Pedobacter kyonggii]|uniref:Uncharacterized protein n=1 Tax=Pedobacter kyonggii TaxID=1926871 RepID=A0A4Q9HG98_9SPHI|nr:hypothetical protein [Pedobacter kyonggii]TBO44262.1 hypothetical protein EYS08_02835 [Pedobacter kyonggii]